MKMTRHHIKNKSRGGSSIASNLIILTEVHHRSWHSLFQDMNLDEVIAVLTRIRDKKRLAKKFWKSLKEIGATK